MIGIPQGLIRGEGCVDRHAAFVPYITECRTCGYEPADQLSIRRGRCPKCYAFSWHRIPRREGLFEAEDRPQ